MENKHFVYALNCGTYMADGTPIRIFGHSSLETFANRYRPYSTASPIHPTLEGVIVCDSEAHAKEVENAVMSRLWKAAPPTKNRTEVRLGTPDVLSFIETDMQNGEAFLGMDTYAFYTREVRKRNNLPENKAYAREYYQRLDIREKQRKRNQDPRIRERNRQNARLSQQRKRRGGYSKGQTSFL